MFKMIFFQGQSSRRTTPNTHVNLAPPSFSLDYANRQSFGWASQIGSVVLLSFSYLGVVPAFIQYIAIGASEIQFWTFSDINFSKFESFIISSLFYVYFCRFLCLFIKLCLFCLRCFD